MKVENFDASGASPAVREAVSRIMDALDINRDSGISNSTELPGNRDFATKLTAFDFNQDANITQKELIYGLN